MIVKTAEQIEGVRAACQVVAKVHQAVRERLDVGLSTYQLDNIVRHKLRELGAKSAFYKYSQGGKRPFPAYACISVNEEVVHGIGNHTRILQDGDVITIDVGAILNGFYGDAAFTAIVGEVKEERRQIVEQTYQALLKAIEVTRPGAHIFDASRVIENAAEEFGYGSVIDYFGHGVGLQLHEAPQVPNFIPTPGTMFNHELRAGVILTYEPMFTLGSGETEELSDGWTVVTKDRSVAVHWEHTILVTETGAEVLTTLKE